MRGRRRRKRRRRRKEEDEDEDDDDDEDEDDKMPKEQASTSRDTGAPRCDANHMLDCYDGVWK
jgi:hypothetical protein